MRYREPVLGVVLLVLSVVLVASFYPALDDMWVENPNWNGLSEFYKTVEPVRIRSSSELLDSGFESGILYIVGPSRGFSDVDIESIRLYLIGGGTVVLLDDFGTGNQLLEGLGLGTRFSGELLLDSVFFDPVPEFPRLLNFSFVGVSEVVLNYGTTLSLGERAHVLQQSSPLSYIETSEGIIAGTYPVVAEIPFGDEGLLILISDSSVWLNSMIDRADNRVLLDVISNGGSMIDIGHSYPTNLLAFQWWLEDLYQFLGVAEIRYGLALVLVFLIFRIKYTSPQEEEVDPVREVLNEHPDWNKEQLEWLLEQKRKK